MFVPLILFLFFLYKWLNTKRGTKKNLPPSPPKLPILGNFLQLGSSPHRSFRSLSQKYGELILLHLGQVPYLLVSSTRVAHNILKTHDAIFANRPHLKTVYRLFYNAKDVGTSQYGEYWKRMKRICVLHLLSNKKVASFRDVREEETSLLLENIRKLVGSPFNLSDMLSTYTRDVICRVAFGIKYSEIEGVINFNKLWGEFSELIGIFNIGDFIPWLGWVNRVDGTNSRVERVVKEFDHFLEQVLNINENRYQKGEESKNFLDILRQLQEEQETLGFSIGRESIKALMLDMLSGGMDTSLTVMEWTIAELLNHPDIMEELQKEVRKIVGHKPKVNEDDLEQMVYLKAVIKETIRLHPPIFTIGRLSSENVKINGYDIPRGTSVLINIWAILRDPIYWKDPNKFDPKRFLNSSIDFQGNHFEFMPFGAGRRMCPGISFAMTINELVVSNLMLTFDWNVPEAIRGKALETNESIGIIMRKKTPLHVIATLNAHMEME